MRDFLKNACTQLGIELSDTMIDQFLRYKDLLLEHNQHMNLTAITDEREVIIRHFVDSLASVPHLGATAQTTIVDIGTGAGLPGIPLAIAMPHVQFTLVDSLEKRIGFLEQVCEALTLDNVTLVVARTEDLARDSDYREQFDICVSRGVAPLYKLLELGIAFVKPTGQFVAYKGAKLDEEVTEATKALQTFDCQIERTQNYTLPTTDMSPSLLFIQKNGATPPMYPRKPNQIKNNPLK